MTHSNPRGDMAETFRQITLTLAGIFSVYEVEDDVVQAVSDALGELFAEALAPEHAAVVHREGRPARRVGPHPAMQSLLASIDSEYPPPNPVAL